MSRIIQAELIEILKGGTSATVLVKIDDKEYLASLKEGGSIEPERLEEYKGEIIKELSKDEEFKRVRLKILLATFKQEEIF